MSPSRNKVYYFYHHYIVSDLNVLLSFFQKCPFNCKKLSYRTLFLHPFLPILTCHDPKCFACCVVICVRYRDCLNIKVEAECYKQAFKELSDCFKNKGNKIWISYIMQIHCNHCLSFQFQHYVHCVSFVIFYRLYDLGWPFRTFMCAKEGSLPIYEQARI